MLRMSVDPKKQCDHSQWVTALFTDVREMSCSDSETVQSPGFVGTSPDQLISQSPDQLISQSPELLSSPPEFFISPPDSSFNSSDSVGQCKEISADYLTTSFKDHSISSGEFIMNSSSDAMISYSMSDEEMEAVSSLSPPNSETIPNNIQNISPDSCEFCDTDELFSDDTSPPESYFHGYSDSSPELEQLTSPSLSCLFPSDITRSLPDIRVLESRDTRLFGSRERLARGLLARKVVRSLSYRVACSTDSLHLWSNSSGNHVHGCISTGNVSDEVFLSDQSSCYEELMKPDFSAARKSKELPEARFALTRSLRQSFLSHRGDVSSEWSATPSSGSEGSENGHRNLNSGSEGFENGHHNFNSGPEGSENGHHNLNSGSEGFENGHHNLNSGSEGFENGHRNFNSDLASDHYDDLYSDHDNLASNHGNHASDFDDNPNSDCNYDSSSMPHSAEQNPSQSLSCSHQHCMCKTTCSTCNNPVVSEEKISSRSRSNSYSSACGEDENRYIYPKILISRDFQLPVNFLTSMPAKVSLRTTFNDVISRVST